MIRFLALAAALVVTPAAGQEAFPSRALQIILPYAPGNTTDLLARALAAEMSSLLGRPVVVVNREGAAGAVGSAVAARAAPDGHTLLFVPALVASVLPATQPSSGLTPASFRPVCQTFNNTMALVVRPDSPITDLRGLQTMARESPGRVTYGTLGATSIPHLAVEQWTAAAGVELTHVPFRGDGAVMTEVMAGRLDVGGIVLGSLAGRTDVRVVTVFDPTRHRALPDVPSAIEQGFDVAPASFGGLFVPAGTPDDRVAKLEAACAAATASPGYRTVARNGGQPDEVYLGAEAFARRLAEDVAIKAVILRRIPLN